MYFPCRAMNYGALGMVMGHELTHGFDNTGRYRNIRNSMKPSTVYLLKCAQITVKPLRRTFVGNKIFDHSDVAGASPVGGVPTTSSFSTWHLGPQWAPSQYNDHLSQIWGFPRSHDRFIFNMGIPILVRRHFHIETAPWLQWNEQRQLQKETRNIYSCDLVRLILDVWRYTVLWWLRFVSINDSCTSNGLYHDNWIAGMSSDACPLTSSCHQIGVFLSSCSPFY